MRVTIVLIQIEGRISMVVGERTESLIEKRERHMGEMQKEFKAWSDELDFAKERKDAKYEAYCKMMLQICENTIRKIENFEIY